MNWSARLSDYILPKQIDFFGNLVTQSRITQEIINALHEIYIDTQKHPDALTPLFQKAEDVRKQNITELDSVLITPLDREALSRAHVNLDWVVLSIKHLNIEISTFSITSLLEYEKIFNLLVQQISLLTGCFGLLKEKQFETVLGHIADIIRMDDEVISEYSHLLGELFSHDQFKFILQRKEILTQLKEVSKRIHVVANSTEDIVFKMY
jgi:uncharacterized protein Yka (UPF0111/DUF47 family)